MTGTNVERPLTVEQSHVLRIVTRYKAKEGFGMTVGEIADKAAMSRDRVRTCLGVLERRGLAHSYGVGGERSAMCWHPDPEPTPDAVPEGPRP